MKHLVFIFILFSHLGFGQIGGNGVYDFLNLSNSARVSALGGNQIAVKDDDLFLAYANPSLLNEEMDNKFAFTYSGYLADINVGYASYVKNYDSIGTFNLGVQYIDYGELIETDEAGNEIGTFNAGEYALVMGYAYQVDTSFSVGANLKTIYSSFYDFNSLGLAVDVAATYYSEKRGFTLALVAKNAGAQLTTYEDDGETESLPFEIQLGATKRFKHVPVRLGLIVQQIQNWDLTYDNPNIEETQSIFGGSSNNDQKDGFFENVARHLIFNAEFLVSKNFNLRFGYNMLRRRELLVDDDPGTIGFSWGLGFRISRFHLSYGRSAFHQAGATNTFSVSTRLSDFIH